MLLYSKFPGALHHQGEVVIPIDRAADAFIVLKELIEGDNSISLLSIPLGHKFGKDLIRGLLSLNNLWVFASIIDLCDVIQFNLAILIHIKLIIGKLDPFLPLVINVTLNSN